MNEVFEWVSSLDLSVIYTAIIGFATTWGGSIIALTVALIKQRAANINLQVAIEKKGIQLNEELNAKISEFQNVILSALDKTQQDILNCNENEAKKRIAVLQEIQQSSDIAIAELTKQVNPTALEELN